jgi:formyltetrahydrofolate hydrolase
MNYILRLHVNTIKGMQKGIVTKQSGILTGNSIAILRNSSQNAKQKIKYFAGIKWKKNYYL